MQCDQEVNLSYTGVLAALPGGRQLKNVGIDMQAAAGTSAVTAVDSGILDLSEVDTSLSQYAIGENEFSFEERLSALEEAVLRHPLNREILYKMLVLCSKEVPLPVLEERIAACPEFKTATQNPYRLATILERSYGLERKERDVQGRIVFPDRKVGLSEDEVDSLVCGISFEATLVGIYFVEQHRPRARIVELLDLAPERAETYCEMLAFAAERPRSYAEIEQLLRGKPALEYLAEGERIVMQPSVFVDKLERAGALVWDGRWKLTEEGERYWEELKAATNGKQ